MEDIHPLPHRDHGLASTIPPAGPAPPVLQAVIGRAVQSARPLLGPFVLLWASSVALAVIVHSRTLRVYDAGLLPAFDVVGSAAYLLAPNALLSASRRTELGLAALIVYAAIVAALLAGWFWSIRAGRQVRLLSVWSILALTTAIAAPYIVHTGLFSDDVYLYYLYGRTIETHGGNPLITPPVSFPYDPHLQWVYWKYLPSAYGPVWLLFSAGLSRIAGDSITAAVIAHRLAGLLLHLGTVGALWVVLRRTRPAEAVAGTLFFAWNPLVLLEAVANAHNDAMVALFAVLIVAAAGRRAWSWTAVLGAGAVMVKPFAMLLLLPVALRIVQTTRGRIRIRTFARTIAIGAVALILLSLPLWAGLRLVTNVMKNPASHMYTNTVWELISEAGPAWLRVKTVAIQHPYLDAVRALCFFGGAAWLLTRRWARRGVAQTALPLWLLFCLTASWVWPWYFVPAIVLAALAGGGGLVPATALTIGGLLFWVTWPPPQLVWLHTWRSLLLFGPLLLTLVSAPVRALVLSALGVRRPPPRPDSDNAVDVRLQTATS